MAFHFRLSERQSLNTRVLNICSNSIFSKMNLQTKKFDSTFPTSFQACGINPLLGSDATDDTGTPCMSFMFTFDAGRHRSYQRINTSFVRPRTAMLQYYSFKKYIHLRLVEVLQSHVDDFTDDLSLDDVIRTY